MFLALKFGALLAGLVVSGAGLLLFVEMTQKNIMAAVAAAGVMFYLPDLFLYFIGKLRKSRSSSACPTRST